MGVMREQVVDVGRHHVGDQQLLGEAHDEEEEAGADEAPAEALLSALELLADVAVADDGAGQQVREQRRPGEVVDHGLGRADHAPVDVDHVRDGGERVERHADRQQHSSMGSGSPIPMSLKRPSMEVKKKPRYLK